MVISVAVFIAHNLAKPAHIFFPHLNEVSLSPFYGRQQAMRQLNACCAAEATLIWLHAPAGTGKTTLLRHWLARCAEARQWWNMDVVYGWEFPQVTMRHSAQDLLNEFLNHTLHWFGVSVTSTQTNSEKLTLLRQRLQQQRVFLLLDNVPPDLLRPVIARQDHGCFCTELLKPLRGQTFGMCLVSTQQAVTDDCGSVVKTLELGDLLLDDVVGLLRYKGITARSELLASVARTFGNHALTLTLLGNYLTQACDGDLRQLDTIPIWMDHDGEGRHTRRVLAAYDKWLAKTPELALLYLLSLFHDAVAQDLLNHVLQGMMQAGSFLKRKPVPTLLKPLRGINQKKLLLIQQRLCQLNLVHLNADTKHLRMHSSVREYFAAKFEARCHHSEAWDVLQTLIKQGEQQLGQPLLRLSNAFSSADVQALSNIVRSMPPPDLPISNESQEQLLEQYVAAKSWQQATHSALRLYEYQLKRGDVRTALHYVRQSVAYAHLSGNAQHLQQNMQLLNNLLQKHP